MEVNRLSRETGHYVLDGVMSVIDVENWKGYEDTSMTAKIQVGGGLKPFYYSLPARRLFYVQNRCIESQRYPIA